MDLSDRAGKMVGSGPILLTTLRTAHWKRTESPALRSQICRESGGVRQDRESEITSFDAALYVRQAVSPKSDQSTLQPTVKTGPGEMV